MPQSLLADDDRDVRFSFWMEGDEQTDCRIAAFKAEEKLFSLTKIEVLLKISSGLSFTDCLGKRACLTIEADGLDKPAHLSGIVAETAEFFEAGDVLTRLTLLPGLARLEGDEHCRVFQELTIPDIAETLLCEHGISDALWQLEGSFSPRRFCMQYGESDLAFLRRILAEEGIFYYFVHEEKGRERPVFCDNIKLLRDCPNGGGLRHDDGGGRAPAEDAGAGGNAASAAVRCHSLRRSFGLNMPINKAERGRNAVRLFRLNEQPRASSIGGIVHLPLPLCGHKISLSCPYDKSLSGIWSLTAARHEGIGAAGGLLSRNPAEYFDEDLEAVQAVRAETAADNACARALSAAVPLPRLMLANGGRAWGGYGAAYDAEEMAGCASPYGAPYQSGHNIVPLSGRGMRDAKERDEGAGRKTRSGARQKAVYACAFTGLDGKADYRPPKSLRPVIAGPQAARLIQADTDGRRYKLELEVNAGGSASGADAAAGGGSEKRVRFWAYADTELGAAVEQRRRQEAGRGFSSVIADGAQRQREGNNAAGSGYGAGAAENSGARAETGAREMFLLAFLGGNPDKPIIVSSYQPLRGEYAAPAYGREKPQTGESAQAADGAAETAFACPPNVLSAGLRAGMQAREQSGAAGQSAIPLAQMKAKLSSGAAHGLPLPPQPGLEPESDSGSDAAGGSRVLRVAAHQREDIHGIYELNCGEKYLCRTGAAHINAGERLVLRGPGGRIIIDKYSMTLEAPTIRLKGRLCVEEDAFERQEGMRAAIRDELPLVSGCSAPAAPISANSSPQRPSAPTRRQR